MSEWKEVEIGSICKIIGGYAFKSKDFIQEGIPVIKIKNLKGKNVSVEDTDFVDPKFLHINQKFIISYNDILVALTGSHITLPASAVGRVVKSRITDTLLMNQRVGKFQVNNKLCDHDYMYYVASSDAFFDQVGLRSRGAANQANISGGDIEGIKIQLPPLPAQKKIAKILSNYDDLIENNLKRIKLLEESARLTYEEWFLRFRIDGDKLGVDSETGLPFGWRYIKLKECCDLTMGQSPKSEFYNELEEGLPFHQGVTNYGFRFPTNSTWSTAGTRVARKGDILFSVRAPVGRLNIAIENIILGRGLSGIRHKEDLNSFLFYQLQNIFFEDNLMGGGVIFDSVTKRDVESISIRYSDEFSKNFDDLVQPMDSEIENLTNQNQLLKEARDILLPRLMTGMIDVEKMDGI